jgi:flagellar assembly protein FliH
MATDALKPSPQELDREAMMNLSTKGAVYKKFEFGTVYGDGGNVVSSMPKEKKFYTPDEVEDIRQQAYTQGELSALAKAQMAQAEAVQAVADAANQGLESLNDVLMSHKTECVELALICAQKIASQALELFPDAPVKAALTALGEEISGAPRLIISTHSPEPALQKAIREASALTGFSGAIQFREAAHMPRGAFEIGWPEGRAAYDPTQVYEALRSALKDVLLSESFHMQKPGGSPRAMEA